MSFKFFFIGSQETGYEALRVLIDEGMPIVGCFALKPAKHEKWDKDVSILAKNNDIPTWEFEDHLTLSQNPNNINDEKYVKIISDLQPDLIFVLGWRQMIGKKIREIPKHGAVGIHFSLLPKLRGHAPVSWSILTNQEYTGLTLFYFEAGADTGDIILQKKIKINLEDTALTLRNRLISKTKDAIVELVNHINSGEIPRIIQKEDNSSLAAYRLPGHGEINWSKDSLEIYNEIRATTRPYPGAFSFFNGEKVIIWSALLYSGKLKYIGKPGQIISKNEKGLTVITGDGAIILKEIQHANNKSILAHDSPITTKDSFGYNTFVEISKLKKEIHNLKNNIKE